MPVPKVHPESYTFTLGKAPVLREGDDVTIMANGVMVARALDAAVSLAAVGVSARVVNMSSIKPIDKDAILDAARTTRGIVTAEEALDAGGLGGAVAKYWRCTIPLRCGCSAYLMFSPPRVRRLFCSTILV